MDVGSLLKRRAKTMGMLQANSAEDDGGGLVKVSYRIKPLASSFINCNRDIGEGALKDLLQLSASFIK